MKKEYDFSKLPGRKNPYAAKLTHFKRQYSGERAYKFLKTASKLGGRETHLLISTLQDIEDIILTKLEVALICRLGYDEREKKYGKI